MMASGLCSKLRALSEMNTGDIGPATVGGWAGVGGALDALSTTANSTAQQHQQQYSTENIKKRKKRDTHKHVAKI